MLETERLTLRKFEIDDAPFLFELMNSPLYIQNIGDRQIRTESDAQRFMIDRIISSYDRHGYGLYAVVLKQSHQIIGMSGLVNRDKLPHPDIGFAFLPDFMGQGYAFEASQEVMRFAEHVLALDPILGITIQTNHASIKLLNKLGLIHEQEIDWEGEAILLLSTRPLSYASISGQLAGN